MKNKYQTTAYKKIRRERYRNKYHSDHKWRKRKNAKSREWNQNNRLKHIFSIARGRAGRLGTKFNIKVSDLVIPEVCPYLGTKIDLSLGRGRLPNGPSIDRINNKRGYVRGNVQVISSKANTMKADATIDQLIVFAKNVLKIHG